MDQAIALTASAAAAIRDRIAQAPAGTKALRLRVVSTGCSGNKYEMEYVMDSMDSGSDDVFERDGAILWVPKTDSWMLFGTLVDYVMDDLGNERFEFSNPNEKGRCGCGESFTV